MGLVNLFFGCKGTTNIWNMQRFLLFLVKKVPHIFAYVGFFLNAIGGFCGGIGVVSRR